MPFKNTTEKFGILTKSMHWLIFVLFVVQYFLVYRREYFPKGSPEKSLYMMLHKSFGLMVLAFAVLMIISHHIGKRPLMPSNMSGVEKALAKFMHFLLFLAMLIMPLSGIAMSMYGGYPVKFFQWFELPQLVAKNEQLGDFFYATHVYSSFIIIGLVSLHALAALYHHFVRRDNVLKRMI